MIARSLRLFAFAIAVAAAIDPAITLSARSHPDIAVVAGASATDSALAARVTRELRRRFNVIQGSFAQAAATVFVGDRLTVRAQDLHGPVFAVTPARANPSLAINSVRAPESAPLNGRIAVSADVRVNGGRGGTLETTLSSGGVVLDRVATEIARDQAVHTVTLELTPTIVGTIPYTVTATLGGGAESARVDGIVDVRDQRWSVLFYDPRPSWQSTFARRALERDPRFAVTSRVITSRAHSRDVGAPPADLADAAALAPFDVVVVGAPDALSETVAAGLDALMRRYAASVVLLFDRPGATPMDRSAGVTWTSGSSASPVVLQSTSGQSVGLKVTEAMWPARLPGGSSTFAQTPAGRDSTARPVVWSTAVGPGRLLVSGALNAWQFRSTEFDRFWQSLIGEAAGARPSALEVQVAPRYVQPGERVDVQVSTRTAALSAPAGAPLHADVAAVFRSSDSDVPVPVWPAGAGTFRASVLAPARPGHYRLVVKSGAATREIPFVVAPAVSRSTPDQRDILRAVVTSHGGRILAESRLDDLSDLMERAAGPERRKEARHPMRSFWWMVPFAFALSGEWWLRRRAGLR